MLDARAASRTMRGVKQLDALTPPGLQKSGPGSWLVAPLFAQ
jgi:hypothetical protein